MININIKEKDMRLLCDCKDLYNNKNTWKQDLSYILTEALEEYKNKLSKQ